MSIDNQIIELRIDNYIKTAMDIANYFDDKEEREQILNGLSTIVELNCKLKEKLKFVPKKSEELINNYINRGDDEINYEEAAQKLSAELESFEPDLTKNKEYEEFKRKIQTLCNNCIDGDEDIAITGDGVTVIDPFTKKRIKEPVKNKCGHVYDLYSVTAVVEANKKTRCPVVGCKSKDHIDLSKLTEDVYTKRYLMKNPE